MKGAKKGERSMIREIISPETAKALAGVPLSSAIKANGVVYCSGQLPIDLKTGDLVSTEIGAQTQQVLENLSQVLRAAGTDLSKALKVTVYMTDLSGFHSMNEVYRRYFHSEPPARTTIGVASLARPGCLIEIDLVALA